jgi:hypothetical protein
VITTVPSLSMLVRNLRIRPRPRRCRLRFPLDSFARARSQRVRGAAQTPIQQLGAARPRRHGGLVTRRFDLVDWAIDVLHPLATAPAQQQCE